MKQETLRSLKLAAALASTALVWNAFATDGKWNADASDNWGTASRWTNSQIADGVGANADISYNITAARTLTLNSARTVGKIRFEDATTSSHDWTFSASGSTMLTLAVNSGSPVIEVANRTVNWNTVITGTQGFTKIGTGTLTLSGNSTYGGNLTHNNGADCTSSCHLHKTGFKASGAWAIGPRLKP